MGDVTILKEVREGGEGVKGREGGRGVERGRETQRIFIHCFSSCTCSQAIPTRKLGEAVRCVH